MALDLLRICQSWVLFALKPILHFPGLFMIGNQTSNRQSYPAHLSANFWLSLLKWQALVQVGIQEEEAIFPDCLKNLFSAYSSLIRQVLVSSSQTVASGLLYIAFSPGLTWFPAVLTNL